MSQKNINMDKVQQITRLFKEGVPIKEIVRRLSISRNNVKKYVQRLPDNPDAKDVVLSPEIAYGSPKAEDTRRRYEDLLQYFSKASCYLGRTGVTREVLWAEYVLLHAKGYSYSQFCHHLKRYERNSDLAMHLEYKPGDLTMFDHDGKRMSIVSRDTGKVIPCACFVAILPFSGHIFATFTPSKKTTDLVTGLNGMILYFGGVTISWGYCWKDNT
jgi:transposase